MTDTPDWVLKEAAKRCDWDPSKTLAQMRGYLSSSAAFTALCRAIEQHEAFRQEVSDVVTSLCNTLLMSSDHSRVCEMLSRRFIIPKPKPDPLVEAMNDIGIGVYENIKTEYADTLRADIVRRFRASLEARGLEIREKSK